MNLFFEGYCLRSILTQPPDIPHKVSFANAFSFTLKARFVPKIFQFLSQRFGHVGKLVDQKDKVNFKIYGVTTWKINNCNTHIAQYIKMCLYINQTIKFGQLIECNIRNISLKNHTQNVMEKLFPDPFLKNKTATV